MKTIKLRFRKNKHNHLAPICHDYGDISLNVKINASLNSPNINSKKLFFSPRVSTRKNGSRMELFSPLNQERTEKKQNEI
jgi:hypothetical protein